VEDDGVSGVEGEMGGVWVGRDGLQIVK